MVRSPVIREDIAWVAGFYEGEGTCGRYGNKYILRISSADKEPIARVARTMGFGVVRGPFNYSSKLSKKPYYCYQLHLFEYVQAFLAMVFPWLSPRRQEQACDCLDREYINEYD